MRAPIRSRIEFYGRIQMARTACIELGTRSHPEEKAERPRLTLHDFP